MLQRRWLPGALCLLGLWSLRCEAAQAEVTFVSAQPVWVAGRAEEMNLTLGFRSSFLCRANTPLSLRLACSTVYRAWVNGKFLAYGPARGPHGYYRVEELPLRPHLHDGMNTIAIEVVGYNVNSYDTLDQPSFLQAEVVGPGNRVLAATGSETDPLRAKVLQDRVQKVQRYSFQRPFIEVYRLTPSFDRWRVSAELRDMVELTVVSPKRLLPRRVPYPHFEVRHPVRQVAQGRIERGEPAAPVWKDRALVKIGPELKGYPEQELEIVPSLELQEYTSTQTAVLDRPYRANEKIALGAGEYQILDMGVNLTGMPGTRMTCATACRIWMVFDEILTGEDVDFKRLSCVNVVSYDLEPGTYVVESLEPYTFRFLKLICVEGQCDITDVQLREYKHPQPNTASFSCSEAPLNQLFEAGVETFQQNTLDVFMDCPSRERAGWLCDSFFTARVAGDLTGTTLVEKNFYENFLLPERFEHLPPGMLPMCYPADHYNGVFIPNWSLWFVVQLEEYLQRSGDREMVQSLQSKVLQLFDYFQAFENEDGLLEKLQGWVFIEWSAANKYVQDVNYPSNMLYAGALSVASRLYGLPRLAEKAERVRQKIREQSFDGRFFVDNALRQTDALQVTTNRTEVCQYFAFYFDVATPTTYPELWRLLRDDFGPDRKQTKAYQEVGFANSLVGNMLRFELLSQNGCCQQILDESSAYLLYMADRTGTLWENDEPRASCNHGFASHIVHTLYRDVLGVTRIDSQRKRVKLRFGALRLGQCRGTLPTADGPVSLQWQQHQNQIHYRLHMPTDYQVEVENLSGKRLVARP